jgi:exopolysaccharide biosynthesis WecB/TagA/CpsF family protein
MTMIDQGKHNVLGVRVDAVDQEAAAARILDAARAGRPLAVSALAVHGVMTGTLDPVHRYRLNHFDLLVPDGQPVRWALRWLHQVRLAERVYGPALALEVCRQAAQQRLPIYFYGSTADVLERLTRNLCARFPGLVIAGVSPSRFRQLSPAERDQAMSAICASGAALTLVGLGCPRQEVWAYECRQRLSMPVLAVGAAFPFFAGTLRQAPPWMQRRGLEWLFRLVAEPRRLWKRYLLLNPLYLALLALQATGLRRFDGDPVSPPAEELRYG